MRVENEHDIKKARIQPSYWTEEYNDKNNEKDFTFT